MDFETLRPSRAEIDDPVLVLAVEFCELFGNDVGGFVVELEWDLDDVAA
jgi:hypothetical protein